MPELPEVETVKRSLEKILVTRRIVKIHLRKPKMLRGQSQERFKRGLMQQKIIKVERRAKYLLIRLTQGTLLVHLGMTGQIFAQKNTSSQGNRFPQLPDKHTHLILELSGQVKLFLRDIRMFGRFRLIHSSQERDIFTSFGPEPLDPKFTAKRLHESLAGRKASIKSSLLNQKVIAGLGNIYVDEALFRAKLAPRVLANKITLRQTMKLFFEIRSVLKEAIRARGTSISDYFDPEQKAGNFQKRLRVYGREAEPCLVCGHLIQKEVVAQRGTHWCPKCQK